MVNNRHVHYGGPGPQSGTTDILSVSKILRSDSKTLGRLRTRPRHPMYQGRTLRTENVRDVRGEYDQLGFKRNFFTNP